MDFRSMKQITILAEYKSKSWQITSAQELKIQCFVCQNLSKTWIWVEYFGYCMFSLHKKIEKLLFVALA